MPAHVAEEWKTPRSNAAWISLAVSLVLLPAALARAPPGTAPEVTGVEPAASAAAPLLQVAVVDEYDGRIRLKLCDCQPATGAPGALSCDKEGFFVSSFARQGQWVAGGGAVPLSAAICCRPCLPDSLTPPDPSERVPAGQRPLAVVSLGCHASTDALGLRCEAGASSFVAGFIDAVHVFAANAFYPVDAAQCCTPALLLDGGDAWGLERCDCHHSADAARPVDCGGNATGAALQGFDYFRLTPVGQMVPVGPATCCGMCLSKTVHPAADCAALGRCSGQGVCLLGRCECLQGWGGADCSLPLGRRGGGRRVPPWAIALLAIGGALLAIAMISAGAHVAQLAGGGGEGGDGDARRPLLLRIEADDCGSVGTTDTESEDEMQDVEARIEGVIQRLEGAPAAAGAEEGAPAAASVAAAAASEITQAEAVPAATRAAAAEAALPVAAASPAAANEELAPAAAAPPAAPPQGGGGGAGRATPEKEGAAERVHSWEGVGPLAGVDCSVCMVRPVQVAVVPCGHIALCRRCSRRLARCPICRKDIARRQKLYV